MFGGSIVHGSYTGSLKGFIFFTLILDSLRRGSIRRPSGLIKLGLFWNSTLFGELKMSL